MMVWLSVCLLFSTFGNLVVAKEAIAGNGESIYLVSLKKTTDPDQWIDKKGLKNQKIKKLKTENTLVVRMDSDEFNNMKTDPDITLIERDQAVTISTTNELEGADSSSVETIPWGITVSGAVYAHQRGISGQSIKIAVLDTGISTNHPDLNIAGGASFVEGAFDYDDDNGHGTHVAGTIGAIHNNYGVMGMSPDAEIYGLKVLDAAGTGYYSSIIQAIEWCIENRINIISMSFGGMENSEILHQVIQEANNNGILIVAAAGNRGAGDETELYPARYSEVISVGSVDNANQRSSFSSTGSELDIMAPGEEILSTEISGGYENRSGTSMAVPHITGAAALLWSAERELTNEQVMNRLFETASPVGDTHDYGHGLVNIGRALGLDGDPLQEPPSPPPPLPDGPGAFDITRLDRDINNMLRSLQMLHARAKSQDQPALAKEIMAKYQDLKIKYTGLRKVPDKVTESVYGSTELSYLESNKEIFDQLKTTYQQVVANYFGQMSADRSSVDVGSSSTGTCCGEIYPTTIEAGESVQVYLYQVQADPVDVIVKAPDGTVIETATLFDNDLYYTWHTTAQTRSGTYTIQFSHTGFFWEENFTVTVINSSPPVGNPIYLNNPVNVQLQNGQDIVYSFTPAISSDYQVFSHPQSPEVSSIPAEISIYTDALLSNLIATGTIDYGVTTEVRLFLEENVTYYVKVSGYYGMELASKLTISEMDYWPTSISVNDSMDIDTSEFAYQLIEFYAPINGTYKMNTAYYGDVESPGNENDTQLFVYSDIYLSQLIAYVDDSNGSLFSELQMNLAPGMTYYIKVAANYPYNVHARFEITKVSNSFSTLLPSTNYDIYIPTYQAELYSFTPTVSGIHRFLTGPYGGYGGASDTVIEIYSDYDLFNLLNYNNNYNGSLFSEISTNMTAGTTYYLVLWGYWSPFNARFSITPPTTDIVPPSAPQINLSTTNWTKNNVTFTLTPGTDSGSGVQKSEYKLGTSGTWTTYSGTVTISTVGQTVVYARSIDNAGNISAETTATCKIDKIAPTVPSINLSSTNWTKNNVTFTLAQGTDSGSGVQKSEYKQGTSGTWTTYSGTVTITTEGQTIVYARTVDNAGNTSTETSAIAKFDKTAPIAPTGLIINNLTGTSITLSWTASADNVGVTQYDIYYGSTLAGSTSGATTYSITGLTSGIIYTFTVKARDAAGNVSQASVSVTGKLFETLPVKSMITGGDEYMLAVRSEGTLWGWGDNSAGQLGDGTTINKLLPVQVTGLQEVSQAKAGREHSIALKSDGTVWTWGSNYYGQLGDGTSINRLTPVQIPNLNGVVSVDAGIDHTVVVKIDGTVWTWGNNSSGQLGDGTKIKRLTPVQVPNLHDVISVAAGYFFTMALKSDGTVWAWGSNSNGRLGDSTSTDRLTPIQVPNLTNVVSIASGNHSVAVKSDGTLWSWGYNGSGQLGDGTSTNRLTPTQVPNLSGIASATVGGNYTLAIKNDGSVWAWGFNYYGELGLGDNGVQTNRLVPVQVTGINAIYIGAGDYSSGAITTEGEYLTWGANTKGQLGNGTKVSSNVPILVRPIGENSYFYNKGRLEMVTHTSGRVVNYIYDNNGNLIKRLVVQ